MAASRRPGSLRRRLERAVTGAARQVLAWERAKDTRVELTFLGPVAMRRLNRRATGRQSLTGVIAFALPQPDERPRKYTRLTSGPVVETGNREGGNEGSRMSLCGSRCPVPTRIGYDHPTVQPHASRCGESRGIRRSACLATPLMLRQRRRCRRALLALWSALWAGFWRWGGSGVGGASHLVMRLLRLPAPRCHCTGHSFCAFRDVVAAPLRRPPGVGASPWEKPSRLCARGGAAVVVGAALPLTLVEARPRWATPHSHRTPQLVPSAAAMACSRGLTPPCTAGTRSSAPPTLVIAQGTCCSEYSPWRIPLLRK